ncbi:unnamed protein product, partial [Discosporangium mesarthrocarpum]
MLAATLMNSGNKSGGSAPPEGQNTSGCLANKLKEKAEQQQTDLPTAPPAEKKASSWADIVRPEGSRQTPGEPSAGMPQQEQSQDAVVALKTGSGQPIVNQDAPNVLTPGPDHSAGPNHGMAPGGDGAFTGGALGDSPLDGAGPSGPMNSPTAYSNANAQGAAGFPQPQGQASGHGHNHNHNNSVNGANSNGNDDPGAPNDPGAGPVMAPNGVYGMNGGTMQDIGHQQM